MLILAARQKGSILFTCRSTSILLQEKSFWNKMIFIKDGRDLFNFMFEKHNSLLIELNMSR